MRSRSAGRGIAAALLAAAGLLAVSGCGGGGGSSAPSMVGIWTGTYRTTYGLELLPYQLVIFPSGDVLVRKGAGLATRAAGALSRDGETVLISYTLGADGFNAVGTLDGDTIAGTFGEGASSTDGGRFSVARSTAAPCGLWTFTSSELAGVDLMVLYPGGEGELVLGNASAVSLAALVGGQWELNGDVLTLAFSSSTGETLDMDAVLDGDGLSGTLGLLGAPASYQPFTARLLR